MVDIFYLKVTFSMSEIVWPYLGFYLVTVSVVQFYVLWGENSSMSCVHLVSRSILDNRFCEDFYSFLDFRITTHLMVFPFTLFLWWISFILLTVFTDLWLTVVSVFKNKDVDTLRAVVWFLVTSSLTPFC